MTDKKPQIHFGPDNPHPLSKIKTELVWDGKYDEYGNRREFDISGCEMPLQKIEAIDEPRSHAEGAGQLTLFEKKSKRLDDFRNMLVWGDNKLVMASLLKNYKGKINLIYIDPPFDVGADFTMNLPIGEGKDYIDKEQSTIEMVAYKDMWGKGTDSYLHIIYERLLLMKSLLSEKGSIYIHVGIQVNHYVRILLEDIFGKENEIDEIVWSYGTPSGGRAAANKIIKAHEYIVAYAKSYGNHRFNKIHLPYSEKYIKDWFKWTDDKGRRYRKRMRGKDNNNENLWEIQYLDESKGIPISTVWNDIQQIYADPRAYKLGTTSEILDYSTQKPEALIERIIKISSDEGDLVADFFCGSGTTGAVAEKLGRRWIMCDLGRFAIHTSRKRMIEIQRNLYSEDKPYRPFDVYNLGRYERQWWQKDRLKGEEEEHQRIVLAFYRAEPLTGASSPLLHGRKGTAFVHVDGTDSILTLDEVKAVVEAANSAGAKEIHCLSWEFEMELKRNCEALEQEYKIKIRLIRIPREVMEKNRRPGIDKIPFFEMATLAADLIMKVEGGVRIADVELTNFLPSLTEVSSKELDALKERAIKNGFDFIDFWAIDFVHKDGQPFKHHWQDYRLRKDRSLKLKSDCEHRYEDNQPHKICVKVIDTFGCDTSILIEVKGTIKK
jgi:adenine-specific DNA-methyltransferase